MKRNQIVIYENESNKDIACWEWKHEVDNKLIARSEEGYLKSDIIESIKTITEKINLQTPIVENEEEKDTDEGCCFEHKKNDEPGVFEWKLRDSNQNTLAIGNKHMSKDEVNEEIKLVKEKIVDAKIVWENEKDDPAYESKKQHETQVVGLPGS